MAHSVHVNDPALPSVDAARHDLVEVAAAMHSLSQPVGGSSDRAPFDALVRVAVERVPGARWASISMLREGRFITASSTAQQAVSADLMQYDIGSGPCVDAVLNDSLCVAGQVGTDPRWSQWGPRAHAEVGVNSVLSQRLHLPEQAWVVGGLNIYSDTPDAFEEAAVAVALILATHGAMVLSQQLASRHAKNLSKALESNREIGVAMGILMNQSRCTQQEAFDVLREASQRSNRKLAAVAAEVVATGTLAIAQVGRSHRSLLEQSRGS